MKNKDIKAFLKKADELRALFVLGQRVIPFLEEIFVFVSEIQPLFEEINTSIKDNLKKMPNASKQLSKVTEATELATNEIMDIVDGLSYKTDLITSNISKIRNFHSDYFTSTIELLSLLSAGIKENADLKSALPEINASIKKLKEFDSTEINKSFEDTNEIVQSMSNDSTSIMMSLQVQDITSQQLAAVNNLLSTVQGKLTTILDRFDKSDMSDVSELIISDEKSDDPNEIKVSKMHREIAYDPDAVDSISNKKDRQSQVDQMMQDHISGKSDEIEASHSDDDGSEEINTDDIDALFSAGFGDDDTNDDVNEIKETENSDEIKGESSNDESQDTNEDLENNDDDTDEEFSQDDIDALFGK